MKANTLIMTCMVVIALGCLTTTQYVCPDGSTVNEPSACATTPTSAQAPEQAAAMEAANIKIDTECSAFVDGEGKPDYNLIYRCQLRKNPTVEFCNSVSGKYEKNHCIVELASVTNNTGVCSPLSGNLKTTCEAVATRDLKKCGQIPVDEQKKTCESAVEKLLPSVAVDCTNKTDEDLAWCTVYAAKTPNDCLQIDDNKYPDEAIFCQANAAKNANTCSGIVDMVMQNLCRKTVLEL
jgi:hypothetical protein